MIDSMDNSLLNPLKEALEVDLNWDPSGQCCLEFEGGIEITLSLHSNYISIRSLLGGGSEHLFRTALSAQYKDPKEAVDVLARERETLRRARTGLSREEASARINEVSQQIEAIISDINSYEVKRVMLLQSKENRLTAGLPFIPNVSVSTYSEGVSEWVCREIRFS